MMRGVQSFYQCKREKRDYSIINSLRKSQSVQCSVTTEPQMASIFLAPQMVHCLPLIYLCTMHMVRSHTVRYAEDFGTSCSCMCVFKTTMGISLYVLKARFKVFSTFYQIFRDSYLQFVIDITWILVLTTRSDPTTFNTHLTLSSIINTYIYMGARLIRLQVVKKLFEVSSEYSHYDRAWNDF